MKYIATTCFLFLLLILHPTAARAVGCDFTVGQDETYTTITAAIAAAEAENVAGKTICVKDNKVYTEIVKVRDSGSATAPFTIKKDPSSATRPKLRDSQAFSASTFGRTFFMVQASNVVIDGLEISRA